MRCIACWVVLALVAAFALGPRSAFCEFQTVRVGSGPVQRSDQSAIVHKDFCRDFEEAKASNVGEVRCTQDGRYGPNRRPGIYLHPTSATDDAVLAYDSGYLPERPADFRSFLVFSIGIRENVPWPAKENTPNGVRFRVTVNGASVFEEDVTASVYRYRAVDVTAYAGKGVRIEFRTNAIDGNSDYDWAVFGEPLLVTLPPRVDYLANAPSEDVGLAVAQVRCTAPTHVKLHMGEHVEEADLPTGEHWLPIAFDKPAPVTLDPDSKDAQIISVMAAPYRPALSIESLALDSPFVTTDRPYSVLLTVTNAGYGMYHGGATAALSDHPALPATAAPVGSESSVGQSAPATLEDVQDLGPMAPGERRVVYWPGRRADASGDRTLTARLLGNQEELPVNGTQTLRLHVFPPEPTLSPDRPSQPTVSLLLGDTQAMVANPYGRITIIADKDKEAYGIAEVWNGSAWQRAATLYPLTRAVVLDGNGRRQELACKLTGCSYEAATRTLAIESAAQNVDGRKWPVRTFLVPAKAQGLFGVASRFGATGATRLISFSGPKVLAGDRAFGAEKDGAIFPGLEFLERNESSSSDRDLARPANDRRVPAPYKITTPMMAVQGQDTLVALMWDIRQQWAPKKFYPAAHFFCPSPDMGLRYTDMSLFVPSVTGEYVPENGTESVRPYELASMEHVQIASVLALTHASHYSEDSLVAAPHKLGLLLESMRSYFTVMGMPEPSAPPRTWDEERALSREAYLKTVWDEQAGGWGAYAGSKPGAFPGYAHLLELDRRAGVDPTTASELSRRIERVAKQVAPDRLWTSEGCHILLGEFPYLYGYLPENLASMRDAGYAALAKRENGQWVWNPTDTTTSCLGRRGDSTIGQAALPSFLALRAARLTGDAELAKQALEAMKQMERYDVPRGAQTWECPLQQPDILAAAQAVRAYCEAYRLTGDKAHLVQARYWAWTGFPFFYTWGFEGYPTMPFNTIAVFGSTLFHHSWIGLPVVWCGLDYAYALQDLAEFDSSFDWCRIARGILTSAEYQQYTDAPSKGCFPDSWDMVKNAPNPTDINPEDILANAFRLNGLSPEMSSARVPATENAPVLVNSAANIANATFDGNNAVSFALTPRAPGIVFTTAAPMQEPTVVQGAGTRANDSAALQGMESGWLYDAKLQMLVLKHSLGDKEIHIRIEMKK